MVIYAVLQKNIDNLYHHNIYTEQSAVGVACVLCIKNKKCLIIKPDLYIVKVRL